MLLDALRMLLETRFVRNAIRSVRLGAGVLRSALRSPAALDQAGRLGASGAGLRLHLLSS